MGLVEVGGNGSVDWRVDVDDTGKAGKKRVAASGHDNKNPSDFKVEIDFDDAAAAAVAWANMRAALAGLGANARRLVFTIPVEANNSDQIEITW